MHHRDGVQRVDSVEVRVKKEGGHSIALVLGLG
jgi:hypothetical protein